MIQRIFFFILSFNAKALHYFFRLLWLLLFLLINKVDFFSQ